MSDDDEHPILLFLFLLREKLRKFMERKVTRDEMMMDELRGGRVREKR